MGITFRHDAAAVSLPSTSGSRKYGQQLVLQQQQAKQQTAMQQQQQKYQSYQAGLDRLFDANRQQGQMQFQFARDQQQNQFAMDRQREVFAMQQQQAEAQRQQAFMDDARKQSGRFIMDAIENGEYDPATARELRQNLIDEAEALGNPGLDATQRSEALNALRARRTVLSANRQPKAPPPSAQEQFEQNIVTDPNTGARYRVNPKGGYEPLELPKQQQETQQFASADEAFRADPKIRKDYMDQAIEMETEGGLKPLTPELRSKAAETARRNYEEDYKIGTPTAAPELPGQAPAVPGQSRSILETPMAQLPDPGQPPSPQQPASQQMALPPDSGQPPSPAAPTAAAAAYDAQMKSQGYQLITPPDGKKPYYYKETTPPPAPAQPAPAPTAPSQPPPQPVQPSPDSQASRPPTTSRFTPAGLTPQEAEARQQIMDMPQEQRITALMPHSSDPLLAGRTIDEALADPEVRKIYDEEIVADARRRGVEPPEYREAMLAVFDDALSQDVLNGGQSMPSQNYAGMHVDDITDPKAKEQIAKLPRPQSSNDRAAIRKGQLYVDPDGFIRSRS